MEKGFSELDTERTSPAVGDVIVVEVRWPATWKSMPLCGSLPLQFGMPQAAIRTIAAGLAKGNSNGWKARSEGLVPEGSVCEGSVPSSPPQPRQASD